jgi:tetratricopeptide (TPR) repeat protein
VLSVLALLVLTLPGCRRSPPALEPIPEPDLSTVTAAARERLEERQNQWQRALEGAAAPPEQAQAVGALGMLYHAYGFLEAARACYANAVRLQPADPRWPYLDGLAATAASRQEEAAAAFQRVVELAPEDLPAWVRLGDALLEAGRIAPARSAFQTALGLDPDSTVARYGLGRSMVEAGDLAAAVEHFEAVLAAQPEAGLVHYRLGQALRSLGREEEARRHLEQQTGRGLSFPDPLEREVRRLELATALDVVRALSAEPEALSEEELVGFAISQFGDVAGAVQELTELVAAAGAAPPQQRARLHYLLGVLLLREGRPVEAEGELRRALDLDPRLGAARTRLGAALTRAGRPAEALQVLEERLTEAPDDALARLEHSGALAEVGRAGEAVAHLRALVAEQPQLGSAWLRLAVLLGRQGDVVGAAGALDRAVGLELPPADRAVAYHRRGELARRRGDLALAEESLRAALGIDPGLFEARLALAGLLGQGGRFAEAAEHYHRVAASRPELEAAWLGEATALILAGRHRDARQRLEAALVALPDNLALGQTLARHLAASPDSAARDGARALALVDGVLARRPSLENGETRAMALAESGRFAEAVAVQERLVAEARRAGAPGPMLERLAGHLERYRRGQTCCDG